MRADSLQTIELLALEDKQGRYIIKVGVERDGGQAGKLRELEVELDEETYLQLSKLNPLSAERVRLSPYAKYDPFRRTYYSSLVKLNKTSSENYYFDCSVAYETMLGEWRRGEAVGATAEQEAAAPRLAASGVAAVAAASFRIPLGSIGEMGTALRLRSGRYAIGTLRLLMLTCMFLLVWFEVEGQLYIDDAKALSEHQVIVSEGAGAGAKQGGAVSSSPDSASGTAANTVSANEIDAVIPQTPADGIADATAAKQPADVETLVESITLDGEAPLYSLPEGYVALTFDDGPSDYTKAIVDLLRERGVAGTFLFVGKHVERYPAEAGYAAEQGMAVGNHSWDHNNLAHAKMEDMSANIAKANEAIAKISTAQISVFRPPYGAMNDELEIATTELGMKMLMWNRDPQDWKAETPDDIVRYFKELGASGGIYVMHEKKATLDALPDIIDYLKEQQLKFAVFQ
ncbi:polysaccharide deacetylase family protein [Paenibacillus sp. LHD-117]|uniref:polysaccharide deacetylase family protein n=1 Tax=Paenibacillus sp. LHD-117 TaxID=3071412 RepID=UPI0027E20036|nr:polysaccharide deacetylase family protein [Paenibacillus sp. LHD-117]MDQ6422189.1 polysaccharide deacetylase family protein [Paenibacillus sp. LHD-117]